MKKLSIVVAALVVAGAVSSQAQFAPIINTTSNTIAAIVVGPLPITFKGKLSNKGSVDAAALAALTPAGSGAPLQFAAGYEVAALSTGQVGLAIGTSLGTSNITSGVDSGAVVLVGYEVLTARDFVDLSKANSKSAKFLSGWTESDGNGLAAGSTNIDFSTALNKVVSNATLLVSGTVSSTAKSSKTSSNATDATAFRISAKVTGVWFDGTNTISASIGTAKK